MAREVVWTDPAWEDLEAAAEYIARDSEHYAAAFVQEYGTPRRHSPRWRSVAKSSWSFVTLRSVSSSCDPTASSTGSTHRRSRSLRSSTGPGGHGEFSRGPRITARSTGPLGSHSLAAAGQRERLLVRGNGDITMGRSGPVRCAAVATDGSRQLAMLVRRSAGPPTYGVAGGAPHPTRDGGWQRVG